MNEPEEQAITLEELRTVACLLGWKIYESPIPNEAYKIITLNYRVTPFAIAYYGPNELILNAPLVPQLTAHYEAPVHLTRKLLNRIIDGHTNGTITERRHEKFW